jgi:hypothetical protein
MPYARMKGKTLGLIASVAVAVSLVVAPVVTTGATAAGGSVGAVGTMVPFTPASNDAAYWNTYSDHPATCVKATGSTADGTLTDGSKTVTLNAAASTAGQWELLVVKAGTTNNVIVHPQAGVAYASPTNSGGNQAVVGHWIVCRGAAPVPAEPETVTPALTFSEPTCAAAGTILERTETGITWTSALNADGSTTWTAAPQTGFAFPAGANASWTVPGVLPIDTDQCRPAQPADTVTSEDTVEYDCAYGQATTVTVTTTVSTGWNGTAWVATAPTEVSTTAARPMTADEKMDCSVPQTQTEYGEWVEGEWSCGDTEVEQTREVVTVEYGRDAYGELTTATSSVPEQRTRQLTAEEIAECSLVPGDIASTCVGDVPYLAYSVSLPTGFETDDETPVTITFVNPGGEDVVVPDQALSGSLLWPGAKATEPKMWPGWDLVNGTYVKTDGNFAWTRDGVTVRFEVNPSFETVVEYPAVTAVCADPPKQATSPEEPSEEPGGTDSGDPEPAGTGSGDPQPAATVSSASGAELASTGGGVSPILPIAGGAALLLGLALMLTVAGQRRRATS